MSRNVVLPKNETYKLRIRHIRQTNRISRDGYLKSAIIYERNNTNESLEGLFLSWRIPAVYDRSLVLDPCSPIPQIQISLHELDGLFL